MKKAIITGFFSGVLISAILICATYLRRFLPDTFTANLLFITLFFGSIVTVIWLSLHHCCKMAAVRWKNLGITGIISSVMAALLVSLHGFFYSRFQDPYYIEEILRFSKRKYTEAGSLLYTWDWLSNPLDNALYNFRDVIIGLVVISLAIAVIYYARHRNRLPQSLNNEELIF